VEVASIAASIVSIVIAVMAIWLTITFFRMSTEASAKTNEAAKEISASVSRLENLFDRLYADTFSMMRDTVSDMRRHIWPQETAVKEDALKEVEKRAEEKAQVMRKEISEEIAKRLGGTDARVQDMMRIMDRAIDQTRRATAEAGRESVRADILRMLESGPRSLTASDVVQALSARWPASVIVRELEDLRRAGTLSLSDPDAISPRTLIRLRDRFRPAGSRDTQQASRRAEQVRHRGESEVSTEGPQPAR
jgi:hypothetical protein